MGNSSSNIKTPIDCGAYVGYTQGGGSRQLPTLYFENGRLTQEHKHPDNVGWHPLKDPDCHVRINIIYCKDNGNEMVKISGPITHTEIGTVVDHYLTEKAISIDHNFLFEFNFEEKKASKRHRSRGELLFDGKYDEDYALTQIASAELALKER